MDLASEATSIDQPLCPDCTLEVQRDLEQQIKDLEAELSAYTALKNSLEAASAAGELTPMDDKQFQKELKKAQEEVKLEEYVFVFICFVFVCYSPPIFHSKTAASFP